MWICLRTISAFLSPGRTFIQHIIHNQWKLLNPGSTRPRVLKIYDRNSQQNAIRFIDDALSHLSFRAEVIQTDNGSEFGSQFHWHLLDKGIGHVYIRPHRPRLNGKVEGSHRIDEEEFYRLLDGVIIDDTNLCNEKVREWEWCSQNPVQRVSQERVRNDKERWLTLEEEKKLLAFSPKWLQEIITFAVNTGLRQSVILNLQWTHVDLFRRTITILKQKNRGKDTLPVNGAALQVLKARAKVRHIKSNYVFFNGSGNPFDARNLLRAFYSARRKAKINVPWVNG